MEAKLKHLEFIQSAVSRMSNNSFLLKGWGITIVGGLLALTFKEVSTQYVHVALAVLVFFWLLDSFYLSCERRFIRLYDHVRQQQKGETDFSMHLKEFKRWYDWPRCAFSKTMVLFYGGLAVVQLFVLNYYL